jgi:hypothetical protein
VHLQAAELVSGKNDKSALIIAQREAAGPELLKKIKMIRAKLHGQFGPVSVVGERTIAPPASNSCGSILNSNYLSNTSFFVSDTPAARSVQK